MPPNNKPPPIESDRVLSLITAPPGWYALFADDPRSEDMPRSIPVACFGVVEQVEEKDGMGHKFREQRVAPFVCDGLNGMVRADEEEMGYLGLIFLQTGTKEEFKQVFDELREHNVAILDAEVDEGAGDEPPPESGA